MEEGWRKVEGGLLGEEEGQTGASRGCRRKDLRATMGLGDGWEKFVMELGGGDVHRRENLMGWSKKWDSVERGREDREDGVESMKRG